MKLRDYLAVAGAAVLGSVAWFNMNQAGASDHADPPGIEAEGVTDAADFFVWHQGEGDEQRVVVVFTFAAGRSPGDDALYSRDPLYAVHFDLDGDAVADKRIEVRFGQNSVGRWGVKFTGVPGVDEEIVGRVGTALSLGGTHAWAGLADDPTFFDQRGLREGDFDATRDAFAGTNATAVAIEFDAADLIGEDGSQNFASWLTVSEATE